MVPPSAGPPLLTQALPPLMTVRWTCWNRLSLAMIRMDMGLCDLARVKWTCWNGISPAMICMDVGLCDLVRINMVIYGLMQNNA